MLLAWGCLMLATASHAADTEPGMDRPGGDFKTFELTAPLPGKCQVACDAEPQCRAWTFAWPGKRAGRAHCSLKSEAPSKTPDSCCISGLRSAPVQTAEPQPAPAQPEQPVQPEPDTAAEAPPAEPVDLATACDEYAKEAVKRNQENEDLLCNLSGSRWGYSYERYHNWCMTKSSAASRKSNTRARTKAIDDCRAEIGWPSEEDSLAARNARQERACKAYADLAIRQASDAQEKSCNVSGPRWLTAYQPHFSWCMTVSKAERESETRERNKTLTQCTADAAASVECDDYARIALSQTREADERRCGFEGQRWTRNYGAHLNWCRTATTEMRANETRIRAQVLGACRGRPRVAAACSRFAASAISAAQQNVERGCGFQGTRWSRDRERHFQWCMGAKPHERRRERSTRIKALLDCSRGTVSGAGQSQPQRPQSFQYRWRKVAGPGGEWTSEWFPAGKRARCEHLVRGCQCGAANYCGRYREGEVALWWSNGCVSRPWEILCEIRPR